MGCHMGNRIIRLDSVDSTNRYVRDLAREGAEEGLVVISREQSAGRGRRGRSFQSTEGLGLYLSVLLRPKLPFPQLSDLTAWTAVAVCDGVEAACGVRPGIKWVNDLVMENRKLGGILTELDFAPDGTVACAVVGIGLNVFHRQEDFQPELRDIATSLTACLGRDVDMDALTQQIIAAMGRMYALYPQGRQEYLEAYRRDCITVGKPVRLISPASEQAAFAEGVDDDFRLVVRLDDGSHRSVATGEVSVRGLWGYM